MGVLRGEVSAEKKIGTTESDVLSQKSQNENSSHRMHPPSVGNPRKPLQRLPNPFIPINMGPLPF